MFEFLSFKVLNEISALFSASKFRVVQFSMINFAPLSQGARLLYQIITQLSIPFLKKFLIFLHFDEITVIQLIFQGNFCAKWRTFTWQIRENALPMQHFTQLLYIKRKKVFFVDGLFSIFFPLSIDFIIGKWYNTISTLKARVLKRFSGRNTQNEKAI